MSQASRRNELDQAEGTVLLPLFPLRLVLFPGQVLPLHIFEPRYRMMVNQCVDENQPFGVVLMRDDTPDWRMYSGDVALPHDVGTTAHIRRVERLPDGRLNIVTVGLHRFRVRELRFDKPYLQGMVEGFPLAESGSADILRQAIAVRRLLHDYVQQLSQIIDTEIGVDDLPDDPRALAFVTGSALQLPWNDKQGLLDTPDLNGLLATERQLLSREQAMLNFMRRTEARLNEQVTGPTGYIYPN